MFPATRPEKRQDQAGKAPRIGVFVCRCGHNIAGYLDVASLVESALLLPYVVFARDSTFACSDAGLAQIRSAIAEHDLNRVVVASCTPRTHEPLFQATCEEAGLNGYLFEFVNIRDQCSWVHMDDCARATQKAKDLIQMGVAKAALLEPLEEAELAVLPAATVIGGGMAGMTAALNLGHRGFAVSLVEREAELGGLLRGLDKLYPTGVDAQEVIERCIAEVRAHPLIDVLTSTIVREVRGHIGNYEVLVRNRQLGMDLPLQVGVVIVATGAKEFRPAGLFGYGEDPRVITQGELETLLAKGGTQPLISQPQSPIPTVVMIQCVGARDEKRPYCGRTCCLTAMKNAMLIKEHNPGTEVHVLYRDIEVHGTHFEDYYSQARDWGVIFTRYAPHDPPKVADGKVAVYDELLGAPLGISFDLLVLSTPLVPRPGARELAQMLKVPVDEHGFFLEAHVKLRPLDCATDGVYLCGSAHWPAHLDEAISQAYGAAARAATVLSKEQIRASGAVAHVDDSLCRGCERCTDACEFGAVQFVEVDGSSATFAGVPSLDGRAAPGSQPTSRKVAWVNPVLCKGCGACAVLCPTGAMQAAHYTDAQMKAMVQAALGGRGGLV